jgi:hypothetical protein
MKNNTSTFKYYNKSKKLIAQVLETGISWRKLDTFLF